jgi:hypothetical protein
MLWLLLGLIDVLAAFLAKERATGLLPHFEKQRQQIVNDFLPSIVANLCSDWLHTSIDQILAVFTSKNNRKIVPAAYSK